MDNRTVIGSRINSALAFSNKKQKELAAHLGVPDNTISYFCSGKRVPNAEQIIEIAKFLNVSSDYILGLTKNATINPSLQAACEYTKLDENAINKLLKYNKPNSIINFIINEVLSDDLFYDLIIELQGLLKNDRDYAYTILMFRLFITSGKSEQEINTFFTLVDYQSTMCDVSRYRISQLVENLSEHFDNRKKYDDMELNDLFQLICTIFQTTKEDLKKDLKKHEDDIVEQIEKGKIESFGKQQNRQWDIHVCKENIKEAADNGKHNPSKE